MGQLEVPAVRWAPPPLHQEGWRHAWHPRRHASLPRHRRRLRPDLRSRLPGPDGLGAAPLALSQLETADAARVGGVPLGPSVRNSPNLANPGATRRMGCRIMYTLMLSIMWAHGRVHIAATLGHCPGTDSVLCVLYQSLLNA